MTNKNEEYNLTDYEKDLLVLSIEQLTKKYPLVGRDQIVKDFEEMACSQEVFRNKTN